jgi:hypothetical protein
MLSPKPPSSENNMISYIARSPLCVTAQIGTRILRDHGGRFLVVSKELCYGKAETLEDAEEVARGWRYNLVR